jgi:hypothetical protein
MKGNDMPMKKGSRKEVEQPREMDERRRPKKKKK